MIRNEDIPIEVNDPHGGLGQERQEAHELAERLRELVVEAMAWRRLEFGMPAADDCTIHIETFDGSSTWFLRVQLTMRAGEQPEWKVSTGVVFLPASFRDAVVPDAYVAGKVCPVLDLLEQRRRRHVRLH